MYIALTKVRVFAKIQISHKSWDWRPLIRCEASRPATRGVPTVHPLDTLTNVQQGGGGPHNDLHPLVVHYI